MLVGMGPRRGARVVLAIGCCLLASGGWAEAAPPQHSRSIGLPWEGRLAGGVQLLAEGDHFITWDGVFERSPNRAGRRYASDRLLHTVLGVIDDYAAAHPDAPRVVIGDLSRRTGGDFGARFGAPGHASHQSGLDADVYYPRRDGLERPPRRPSQIDRVLAQDLVDRFVAAGATNMFVGPRTRLTGPPSIVEELPSYHDNHMHLRLAGEGVRAALVGTSTLGQPIRAFILGRGPTRVLVVGCIHGDECAGSVVATRLLHALAPPDGSIWIVPDLNPDGHAAKRRTNSHGVDLNRNFPGTWQPLATAGDAPGSELETRVAMALIRRIRPHVTIWFHQPQALVRARGASVTIARRYARLARMRFASLPRPPGSATAWQGATLPGTRAFVVELPAGELGIRDAGQYATAILKLVP
jgi:hypothetical protein